jgi:hypothetical protein
MLEISGKYRGPTGIGGSCVRAPANHNIATLQWDSALDGETNHRAAAVALCDKQGWDADRFFGGVLEGGHGCPCFPAIGNRDRRSLPLHETRYPDSPNALPWAGWQGGGNARTRARGRPPKNSRICSGGKSIYRGRLTPACHGRRAFPSIPDEGGAQ